MSSEPASPCAVCGHLQSAGDECDQCGMPIRRVDPAPSAPRPARRAEVASSEDDEPLVRCGQCAVQGRGARCRNCGLPLRPRLVGL
jgi:hypothetical protein